MKRLGYKLTWPTTCFLGCSADVWAHTNGDGDFVLLDSLGPPWPVHPCYETRQIVGGVHLRDLDDFELSDSLQQLLHKLDEAEGVPSFDRPAHVTVVDPSEYLGRPFVKRGLVEFYRERRLDHFTRGATSAESAGINRLLGSRLSELAIVDRNGNLFAMFADLHDTVISAGAMVEAEISACRVPIKKLGCVFLCHSLRIISYPRTERSGINPNTCDASP